MVFFLNNLRSSNKCKYSEGGRKAENYKKTRHVLIYYIKRYDKTYIKYFLFTVNEVKLPATKYLIPVLHHLKFYPRTNRTLMRFSVLSPTHLLHEHLICTHFSKDFPEKEDVLCSYLRWSSLPIALQTPASSSSWEQLGDNQTR